MAEGTGTPTGLPFAGGLRRTRSYETLRTPLDLRNVIVRDRLRELGIDPDRLAEMTPAQQAHILAQVQGLSQRTGELRTAAERVLAEDWRRMREERDGPANDRTTSAPVSGVGTDLARTLLGADFSSGVSAAFLQWAQANYTETYTPYSGESFRTTAERAQLYRGLQDAYRDAPPADRERIDRTIIRPAEDFFRRADEDEQNRRPLSPRTIQSGVDAGIAATEEQRRNREALARALARIDAGADPETVFREEGIGGRFRQVQAMQALIAEIQRRLPGDSPEAQARRDEVRRRLLELRQRFLDAGRSATERVTILRELSTFLDGLNVTNEQELLARLDGMITRTEAWERRQQETTQITERIGALDRSIRVAGEASESEAQDLAGFHRRLSERIAELEAPRPGDPPGQNPAWRTRALAADRALRTRAEEMLRLVGRPELIGAPPPPTPSSTPPTATPPSASGPAKGPPPSRPAAAPHTPSAADPLP